MTTKSPYKRINISLPVKTVEMLNRVAPKGQKSQVVSQALEYYVENIGKAELRKQMMERAKVHADRDLAIAEEWFHLEEEADR